jgi:hypothetical protein
MKGSRLRSCHMAISPHDSPRQSNQGWFSNLAASIAAPAIIIGASTVYFAGTVYRDTLLGFFGLPGAALQESLQATMASGYLAILTAALFMIPGFLTGITSGYLNSARTSQPSGVFGFLGRHERVVRPFMLTLTVFLFAGAGWYAGTRAADMEYSRLKRVVSGGCEQCFLYKTVRGQVVAVPIGQDASTIILATRRGTAILPASGIRAIRPINPRPPAWRWKWLLI